MRAQGITARHVRISSLSGFLGWIFIQECGKGAAMEMKISLKSMAYKDGAVWHMRC